MEGKKWYGLTIPKKAAKVNTKGKSVFESDDSDDNVEDRVTVKKEPSSTSKEKKKVASESKPEEIDPTIYEYDSIYDEMKASEKQKTSHTKTKAPRYINLLLKAAERRKKESERRVERKIQAERVKEGDEFKDKDAFVTSAYRKKMLEMEEEEERERRESALEEMMDSTKQKDLSGFYRHFLKQTVGEEKIPEFGERDAKIDGSTQKKPDCPKADKSKQRSESPGARNRTKHPSPEKKVSYSDLRNKTERSHRSGSLNKPEIKESQHYTTCDFDKLGHSASKSSSSRRNKDKKPSCSSSDSEFTNSRSEQSKPESSLYRSKSRQQSNSSSDSEVKNSKSGYSKHKSSSHRSHGRQQSCSSSDSEGRNSKSLQSKYKVPHQSNERQQSYSSSDSESKKNKQNAEKSHKKKLDSAAHGSKYVHDERQKYSQDIKIQEEKIHDRTKSDHHTVTKQASSEKYSSGHSSKKANDQRSKHERDTKDYKKDVRTHHRKEKESLHTSSKSTSGNQSYSERKLENKAEYSKCGSNYNHGEVKKHSGSKRKESSICADYPESKKKKQDDDDDDDDDTSHTSSEEGEVKMPSSPKVQEGKKAPANPKTDMVTKFAKRTVGKVFDDAQTRYFKRRDAAKAIN